MVCRVENFGVLWRNLILLITGVAARRDSLIVGHFGQDIGEYHLGRMIKLPRGFMTMGEGKTYYQLDKFTGFYWRISNRYPSPIWKLYIQFIVDFALSFDYLFT